MDLTSIIKPIGDLMHELKDWIGYVTIVGAFVAWLFSVRKNKKLKVYEKKRVLYENLIENIFRLLSTGPGKPRSEVLTQIEKSWLFASDQVIYSCYKILKIYDEHGDADCDLAKSVCDNEQVRNEFGAAIAELFFKMRSELMESDTSIPIEWVKENVKVYKSGAPAAVAYRKQPLNT